jgi:hypothetical protein
MVTPEEASKRHCGMSDWDASYWMTYFLPDQEVRSWIWDLHNACLYMEFCYQFDPHWSIPPANMASIFEYKEIEQKWRSEYFPWAVERWPLAPRCTVTNPGPKDSTSVDDGQERERYQQECRTLRAFLGANEGILKDPTKWSLKQTRRWEDLEKAEGVPRGYEVMDGRLILRGLKKQEGNGGDKMAVGSCQRRWGKRARPIKEEIPRRINENPSERNHSMSVCSNNSCPPLHLNHCEPPQPQGTSPSVPPHRL